MGANDRGVARELILESSKFRGLPVELPLLDLEDRQAVKVGDVVRLTARLNAAFTSSMEIGVRVEREHTRTGERSLCADARATFVNLGEDGTPRRVPPLLAETEEDRRLAAEATERRNQRRSTD